MKLFFFFINIFWYVLTIFFPIIKWVLSLMCVFYICKFAFGSDQLASTAGITAGLIFLLLSGLFLFQTQYRP